MTDDNCWACPNPFTSWRLLSNPPWGAGRTELDFLKNRPSDAVPACEQHKTVRVIDGQPAPVAPREAGVRRTWSQRRKDQYQELRDELLTLLGGKCKQCPETDKALLCVSVRPGLWANLDLSDRRDRTRWLLRHPDYAVVLCVDHIVTATVLNSDTRTHRERVIEAYGGACSSCGSTERLGIVAGPDAPPLKWPGGSKYSSRDKLAWLIRRGFPAGWSLRCPRHYGQP